MAQQNITKSLHCTNTNIKRHECEEFLLYFFSIYLLYSLRGVAVLLLGLVLQSGVLCVDMERPEGVHRDQHVADVRLRDTRTSQVKLYSKSRCLTECITGCSTGITIVIKAKICLMLHMKKEGRRCVLCIKTVKQNSCRIT